MLPIRIQDGRIIIYRSISTIKIAARQLQKNNNNIKNMFYRKCKKNLKVDYNCGVV